MYHSLNFYMVLFGNNISKMKSNKHKLLSNIIFSLKIFILDKKLTQKGTKKYEQ